MNFIKSLLEVNPGTNTHFYTPWIALICILFVSAIVFSVIYDKRKKYDFAFKRLFRKTSLNLSLFGLLFLFLMAVRYEHIPYFSIRIFLYASVLGLIYFLYRFIKVYKTDYQREKENVKNLAIHSGKKAAKKYLPNKHKK